MKLLILNKKNNVFVCVILCSLVIFLLKIDKSLQSNQPLQIFVTYILRIVNKQLMLVRGDNKEVIQLSAARYVL